MSTVRIRQLQILSHQAKIASRMDVYVARGPDLDTCKFSRLGRVSLDSNERSEFKVRRARARAAGDRVRPARGR